MIRREVLGLYGPNRNSWSNAVYEAYRRARVSWGVWRLDADPTAPGKLRDMGVQPIAQAIDRFNGNAWLDPAHQVIQDYNVVSLTCPPGTPFVPDNEPNLNPLRAGTWYAEQWTRYLRAYMAMWRWHDHAGRHPLITPPLAVGPDRNGSTWHSIGRENLQEADGQGLHAYWQYPDQTADSGFGQPWSLLPNDIRGTNLYVLEYSNTLDALTHEQTLDQYEAFLAGLPASTRCAALFLLDPTADWQRFALSEAVLDWLAGLQ